jgi:hypothetical protein
MLPLRSDGEPLRIWLRLILIVPGERNDFLHHAEFVRKTAFVGNNSEALRVVLEVKSWARGKLRPGRSRAAEELVPMGCDCEVLVGRPAVEVRAGSRDRRTTKRPGDPGTTEAGVFGVRQKRKKHGGKSARNSRGSGAAVGGSH